MRQDSRGVAAKLIRAAQLLNELEGMTIDFMVQKPYELEVTFNRSKMQYRVEVKVSQTPDAYAVIFGEILHDIRSALDYTARLLVLSEGKKPIDDEPKKTAFPVFDRRRSEAPNIVPGLSDDLRAVLDAVQPYNDPDPRQNLLWRLQYLNNVDKHRLLNVTALIGSGGAAFVPAPLDPERPTTQEQRRHLVRLVPGISQVFDVTEDEVFEPATVAGMWGYTVGLGGPDAGFSDQLVGTGRELLMHVAEDVMPRFGVFLD